MTKQPTTFEKFQIYRRGWMDGSRSRTAKESHLTHLTLGSEYKLGYKEGRRDFLEAMKEARERIGYHPNQNDILRKEEDD